MDIVQKYKYLIKPTVAAVALYFTSSDVMRYITNILTIMFLIIESYTSLQFIGRSSNVLKFWIMFGIILGFDYISNIVFGKVMLPMLTNGLRIAFLTWLMYDLKNVSTSFAYLEPYLKIAYEQSVILIGIIK